MYIRKHQGSCLASDASQLDGFLASVYGDMHRILRKRDIIQGVETTVGVLHEPGRASLMQPCMWLLRSRRNGPPIDRAVDYRETRSTEDPADFLSVFSYYLHVDGFAGYEKVPRVTRVRSWAHARRGFVEALAVVPQEDHISGTSGTAVGLEYCKRLVEIVRELNGSNALRATTSLPSFTKRK